MSYRVVPIHSEFARNVREKMIAPQYGHPAFASTATSYGPCRQCLKTFETGREERILFTYNAFENLSNLPQPGPVFIHRAECESYADEKFPPGLVDLPLLFEGYGEQSELVRREKMEKEIIEDQIDGIFARPEVDYINIRNAEAGCFVARIERI